MAKMLCLRAAAMGLSAGLVISSATFAQGVPAELPPSSYSGDQYVDSQGCIFVRVGYGAATEWVPRVGRDRQQICGMAPTTNAGPSGAPDLMSNDTVVVIGEDVPPAAPAPAPAPVVAAAPAPSAPAPRVVAPAPAPVAATGCPNLPASAQPYFVGDNVRCGPQANHPGVSSVIAPQSSYGGGGSGGETVTGTPRTFVLSNPPAGYQLAWDDGRLNPYRGLGTPSGDAQMLQVWTDEVPRRLAPVVISGSAQRPQLSYALPEGHALSVAASSRAPLETGGDVRAPRSRVPSADEPATPANEVRVGAGHRHVLAGTFGGQSDAAAAYQRLASAGLPARIGQVRRQGQTLFVVMAGPYNDPQSLGRALLQTRGAGFPSAVTRN